jgi:hypothetical protein
MRSAEIADFAYIPINDQTLANGNSYLFSVQQFGKVQGGIV